MTRRPPNELTALLLLLAACSETEEGDRNRIVAMEPDVTPIEQRVDGGDMSTAPVTPPEAFGPKVFIVDMNVNSARAVTLTNPRVHYGVAPNDLGNPPMYNAHLLDAAGTIVDTKPLWDPRWTFVWSDEQDRDFVELGDSGKIAVIFPFDPTAVTIAVLKDKKRLAAIDITGTITEFCGKNREDPDCRDAIDHKAVE